jgi:hypothetical protein
MWTAFWHVLYFVILLAMAILWRPTTNNTRYAYSEMPQDGDDEITLQPLNLGGDVVQRKPPEEELKPENIKEVKLDEFPVVFSISDGDDAINDE